MQQDNFIPICIAVLTVSDTRTAETDTSGKFLVEQIQARGHVLAEKVICKDNKYQIRHIVSKWIANPDVQAVLLTGGTGLFDTDVSPEAIEVLFDKRIDGFGELFRMRSYEEIGTSTIQSRVLAGIANKTLIFVLPGSTNACKTGWQIIEEQLDSTKKKCSFVNVLTLPQKNK